jgi:prepilin-type N-terminal cleavage/methylation domain-containing protein
MTISATGERRGFTLLEVLLVIALIALFGWIFVGASSALLGGRGGSADEQFWAACGAARKQALEKEKTVTLAFDAKTRAFVLNDGTAQVPMPLANLPEDLVIDFHAAQTAGQALTLIGGTLVEAQPIPFVSFYPDGTCTAFRAQIRMSGAAHVLSVDPWTCAPVLTSDAPR